MSKRSAMRKRSEIRSEIRGPKRQPKAVTNPCGLS